MTTKAEQVRVVSARNIKTALKEAYFAGFVCGSAGGVQKEAAFEAWFARIGE